MVRAINVSPTVPTARHIAYDNLGDGARIAKQLQNQLAQSVILGESQQRLIQRIRSVTGVELNRARRIAQTERVRVQSEGRQLGFNEAKAMGVEIDKQWIARLVNTRDTHAELHGTIIPASESFVTKNGPLEFPGDPDAPAAEIVNCHCFVKPMVKSASSELGAHREKFHEDMQFEEFRKNRLTNAGNGGIVNKVGEKMNVLPNIENAVIPIEKFTQYALNPEKQKDKSIAFQKALGYNLSNYPKLIDNIRANLRNFEAKPKPDVGYGKRYQVVMDLKGENGRTAKVLTAWIDDRTQKQIRLVSVYVDE